MSLVYRVPAKIALVLSLIVPGLSISAAELTHGPVFGGVDATSASVFIRTDVAEARVRVLYETDPSLLSPSLSQKKRTMAASDNTALLSLTGLSPGTTYYINVLIDGVGQFGAPYPSFKTFHEQPAEFSFAVMADFATQSKIDEGAFWPVFDSVAAENPMFVFMGGDFDHRDPETIDDKRNMYKELYDPNSFGLESLVNNVLRKFPIVRQWDDHDAGQDNADKNYAGWALTDQVFREYTPLYYTRLAPGEIGIWQSFSAAGADFFVLDGRSQRDPSGDPDDASKSMLDGNNLGAFGQVEFLKKGLLRSTANWKFIFSSVAVNPTAKPLDSWGAYQSEWDELRSFIENRGITGAIWISGDNHMGAIDNGIASGFPELAVPVANMPPRPADCTTGTPGTWSEGTWNVVDPVVGCRGYGLITVLQNPDRVLLEVKDELGAVVLSHETFLAPQPEAPLDFADATSEASLTATPNTVMSPVFRDLNEDGLPDIYLGKHFDGSDPGMEPELWFNQGDGTFVNEFLTLFSNSGIRGDTHGSTWIDYDNDGINEFMVTKGARNSHSLYDSETGLDYTLAQIGLDLPQDRGRDSLWFDWNNDGLLDVLISNAKATGTSQSRLMEQGVGGFAEVTVESGLKDDIGVETFRVSDLNGDGLADIILLNSNTTGTPGGKRTELTFFEAQAGGGFVEVDGFLPPSEWVTDLVIADFNNDGFSDVYVARASLGLPSEAAHLPDNFLSLKLRNADDPGVKFKTVGEITFDFRFEHVRDGRSAPERVFLGAAGDHPVALPFTLSPDPMFEGIAPHTFGQGGGVYVGYDTQTGTWEVLYSDAANYDKIEIVIQSTHPISDFEKVRFDISNSVELEDQLLIFNPTTGAMEDMTVASGLNVPIPTTSAAAADFDNDGDVDIFLGLETAMAGVADAVLVNDGSGLFSTLEVAATIMPSISPDGQGGPHTASFAEGTKVTLADYNADGFVDVYLNASSFRAQDRYIPGTPAQLLRNTGNGNRWIEIDLQGVTSNRESIGTTVRLSAGGVTQMRENFDGKHRYAQNDSRVHFGLGDNETIDSIIVEWPSGIVQTLNNIASNQIFQIIEP